MKTLHAKRLMKLARFLLTVPQEMFDFSIIVKGKKTPRKQMDCGSKACAIGWCPVVFPKMASYMSIDHSASSYIVQPIKNGKNIANQKYFHGTSEHLFGLTDDESALLFEPNTRPHFGLQRLDGGATAWNVAHNIALFVRKNRPDINTTLS